MSEDRAQKLLMAATGRKDEVYLRLADLDSVSKLIAADIFYHSECIKVYLASYERMNKNCILCQQPCKTNMVTNTTMMDLVKKSREEENLDLLDSLKEYFDENTKKLKQTCFIHNVCADNYLRNDISMTDIFETHVTSMIQDLIAKQYGLRLSEIREFVSKQVPGVPIYNYRLKSFLSAYFGDSIAFCQPYRKNDSEVVYPSSITKDQMIQRFQILDEVATTGRLLRTRLQNTNFKLENKFCDQYDLCEAMFSTRMPETVLAFLCSLLNLKKTDFLFNENAHMYEHSPDFSGSDSSDSETEFIEQETSKKRLPKKVLRAHSLFQTMHYIVNNGKKKTPLQIMNAHITYNKSKSKELITIGNSLGHCVSYTSLRKLRFNFSARAAFLGEQSYVPRPIQFNDIEFCLGSFDNLDHTDLATISGMQSNHDSVMVLFQNKSMTRNKDPPTLTLSDLQILYRGRTHLKNLRCQQLKQFFIKSKQQLLPDDFVSQSFHYEADVSEAIINLIRAAETLAGNHCGVPTWPGARALVSTASLTQKIVGFLPILPHEITKIEAVYTCLLNFKSIAESLRQPTLPIVCDEGVFRLVIQIYLEKPQLFENIFPMLGHFHMAKAALRCAGQFLRGSGAEDSFIESRIFGQKTLESVLTGRHYYRSFCGLVMMGEAIEALKLEAFWSENSDEKFEDGLEKISILKEALVAKDSKACSNLMNELKKDGDVAELISAIKVFEDKSISSSEQCRYLCGFQSIINSIKNLVRSDRDGDFLLAMKSIQELCPIFLGLDGINYLRYASFYLELLKQLKIKHPDLYQEFLKGNHVIKTRDGKFNAVAPDMKLEQTIQRSAKSSGGIIGASKKVDYVTEWSLIFHDVLDICNWFRELTGADKGGNTENIPHHQLKNSKITEVNDHIQRLVNFMKAYGNPFIIDENDKELKNFVSQVYADREVAQVYRGFFDETQELYQQFQENVYVHKTQLLSEKISKYRLMPVDYIPKQAEDKARKEVKKSEKLSRLAIRSLLIGKEKDNGSVNRMLTYDLTPYTCLFDGYEMTSPNKAELVTELKTYLLPKDYQFDKAKDAAIFIDFMSYVRSQVFEKLGTKTFGDMLSQTLSRIKNMFSASTTIHFIFDSYVDFSLKGPERASRGSKVKGAIHLARIDHSTPIPQQMDKFWNSVRNKRLLQEFACKVIKQELTEFCIVLSGGIDDEDQLTPAHIQYRNGRSNPLTELTFDYEEADWRVVPHLDWNIRNQQRLTTSIVVSKDTDIFVYLIHYMSTFKDHGMKELWMMTGVGDKRTLLPIHRLCEKMGPRLCKVLLKTHIGTGCDYLSKVGTKKSALLAKPESNLTTFGESGIIDEHQLNEAENYLVQVFNSRSQKSILGQDTFDEERVKVWKATNSVLNLPPTSHSIREGHIRRWWFIYKQLSNLLNPGEYSFLRPQDYGWDLLDGDIIPQKCLNLVPEKFAKICGCNKSGDKEVACQTKRCKCKKSELRCTEYRQCQNCQNM